MIINIVSYLLIFWLFSYLFVKTDDLIDDIIDFIKTKILKKKTHVTRSLDDIFDDLKNTPLKEFHLEIYRFFLKVKDFPHDFYCECKYGYQRIKKGYSKRDVWGIHCFLISILPDMLRDLKRTKQGIPFSVFKESDGVDETGNPTDEAHEKAKIRWDKSLDSIILTFEIAKKINENHWVYQDSRTYDNKLAKKMKLFQKRVHKNRPNLYSEFDNHVMSKAECRVYEKGWSLLKKHFFSLWD